MPTFHFQALNAAGQTETGQVEAATAHDAFTQLDARGLIVQVIRVVDASGASAATPASPTLPGGPFGDGPTVLQSHLARVLAQSQTIVPALRAYAEEMPAGRRRRELAAVCRLLEQGDAAAAVGSLEALPEYWIPLLSAASTSADPGLILREFLRESQAADELRRQWWLTLAYPTTILAIAAAVLVALAWYVIPAFQEIYDDFDLQLPYVTRGVLAASRWIASPPGVAVIAVAAVLLALLALGPCVQLSGWTGWANRLFGALFGRSTALAQFTRFTADLMAAGVDAPQSLRIASSANRRTRLRESGWQLANQLESGQLLAKLALPAVPATMIHALQSDLPQPSRTRLLKELSRCYADRVRNRLSWTRGVVEPIAIFAVGGLVLLVVIALFMPLVTLINGLSGGSNS
jgi:type IV pilus assembly protein PilC